MTNPNDEHDAAWVAEKARQEELLGPLVPGGAQGGAVARARREHEVRARSRGAAVLRARDRVRQTFRAIDEDEAA